MEQVRRYKNLIKGFLRFGVYKFTEYPMNSIISTISMLLREVTGFVGVLLIAGTIGGMGGWNLHEICVLFAMAMIPEALGMAFFDMAWRIGFIGIRLGMMDTFLVRPASVLLQVFGFGMNFQALISVFGAAALMIYGFTGAGGVWSVGKILFMFEAVIFGTLINTSIYLLFNSLNFWLVQANEIAAFVQTLRQFGKYPMTVFPLSVKIILTAAIPFGFVGYYPAAYLLGKTTLPVPVFLAAVGVLTAGAAGMLWRFGLRSYNSTGT